MEDSPLSVPTAPTPRTPVTYSTVVELYENHHQYHHQQSQQLNNRHQTMEETSETNTPLQLTTIATNSSSSIMNDSTDCQEYEEMIIADKVAKRHTLSRRITDYLLRSLPMLSLIMAPIFMIWSGFYAPSLFFIFTLGYLAYNVYLLSHNFYFGMAGIKRAKRSRFVDFYQKYLTKQRMVMQSKSKSSASYGGNNSANASNEFSTSSSSDEDSQYPQSSASRFKRMRPNRQTQLSREDDVWNKVTHFVIIPNFNERESILRQSLNSLAQQSMARRQIIPVLAMEAREQNVEQKAKRLVNDYILQFKDMLYTVHPSGMPDESPGKGSNSNFAWHNGIKEYIEQRSVAELDPNFAVVTVQDADSIYHESHFDSLTYAYLSSHMKGTNNTSIWQSPMVCYRNFNEIPAMSRMISFVITMHEIAALNDKNYEKISFSTYSMSHNFLTANNGWCPKYITEDWHCTVRTFFNTGGKAKVRSLPFPVSCYSTQGETYYESLYERYIQGKRHSLALTEITYILKRMFLTWKNGSSIPDYVRRRFHKFESRCTEGSAEEYEEDPQSIQIPVNWTRIFKLFWNVTSVQFIGGTQLTMLVFSFIFSQYYSWLYSNAEITDDIYRVNHIWLPLYNLANVCLFVVILLNTYLNGQLITLVNGREYQHKYYWIVHFLEWWIFSFPGTLLFNLIPTYIAAYRILFEEKFFFERSIKPEAPHIYRKKKNATTVRKSRRISGNHNSLSIATAAASESIISEDYVIDVNNVAAARKKKNAPKLSVDVADVHEGTCHGRSDSSSSLSVSNSCSEDEYIHGLSDSSVDPLSPLSVSTSNNAGEKSIFQTQSNVVTHLTAATSRSKNNSVTVR